MPRSFIEMPDTKKMGVFWTDQDPDNPGTTINIQEDLSADIATYQYVADNVAPALNKNIIAIFNRLLTKRIRIQSIFCYPRTLANHTVTLQVGYINSEPTGGTDLTLVKHAFDYPNNQPAPNDVIAKSDPTVTPVNNIIFGGSTFSVNTAGKYVLFEPSRNGSALQLRPGAQDGIVVRQTNGSGTTGSLTVHIVFTLD